MRRPLTPREREVLDHLLTADFPGVPELREQSNHVEVEREWDDCPSIDLVVDKTKASAASLSNRMPVEAWSRRSTDDSQFIQVMLFADKGWLSALELVHFEYIPDEFPPVDELRAPRPFSGDYVEAE